MRIIKFIKYFLIAVAILGFQGLSLNAIAQTSENITVKGTVVDTAGMPLIGVTVIVTGTTKGVISDANGNFSIESPKNALLKFSYLGFKSVEVQAAPQLNIKMEEDNIRLDEVIVVGVGYGTMRKSDLTGAISSVSSEKFNRGVITSAEQLIQGKVAGLTVMSQGGDPTRGSNIRLRGGTSISANNGPLYVVDGVAGVDINTISPSDIKSIDVLKDASAAAIYGSRGANGIIIVTTKSSGEIKSLTEYNGYAAFGTPAKNYDLLSANQWRTYVRENNLADAVDYGHNTDWQKEIERNTFSQSHNLSFSGGSNKTSYRASLGYMDEEGIILKSDLSRMNGTANVKHSTLNDRLKIEMNISSTYDKYSPVDYSVFQRAYNLNPTLPVYNPDESYVEVRGLGYDNPVAMLNQRQLDDTRNRFLAYYKFDLSILEGLKYTLNISYTQNSHEYKQYVYRDESIEGRVVDGRASRGIDNALTYQAENYLTYEKTINDHSFNILGGYSYMEQTNEGFGTTSRGFDTDNFLYNNLYSGNGVKENYSFKSDWKLISFYGRLNYNYNSRYMATFTIRNDGSSKFGKNNKWGLFPSASLAWRISDEEFMGATSDWMNNLKLRAGYGITGSQEGIDPYKSLKMYGQPANASYESRYFDPVSMEWRTSYGIIQNENPDLKWEQTAQLNIGLDFELFRKITGTVEYYNKVTSDLLYTYPVPMPPYPFDKMMANVGQLSNKGVEITLNASIINTDFFKWNIDLNFAYNKQVVDKLSDDKFKIDEVLEGAFTGPGLSSVYTQRIKQGYVVGTFFGYKMDSINQKGEFVMKDLDGDGKFVGDGTTKEDPEDQTVLGDIQPDYTAGLGMSFGIGDFDFSFFMNSIMGQKLLNGTKMSISLDNRLPVNNIPDDARNDEFITQAAFCDYWLEDGSFIRLQNLTLGYNLPFKKNSYISKARIYATGQNLFVITDYSGVDPEINLEGLDRPGIEFYDSYPRSRTWSVGLNLTF